MLDFTCPGCGYARMVPDRFGGHVVKCPKCGNKSHILPPIDQTQELPEEQPSEPRKSIFTREFTFPWWIAVPLKIFGYIVFAFFVAICAIVWIVLFVNSNAIGQLFLVICLLGGIMIGLLRRILKAVERRKDG